MSPCQRLDGVWATRDSQSPQGSASHDRSCGRKGRYLVKESVVTHGGEKASCRFATFAPDGRRLAWRGQSGKQRGGRVPAAPSQKGWTVSACAGSHFVGGIHACTGGLHLRDSHGYMPAAPPARQTFPTGVGVAAPWRGIIRTRFDQGTHTL